MPLLVRAASLKEAIPGGPARLELARARAHLAVGQSAEAFELLRPTDDRDVYLVYTRWATQEAFDAWVNGQAFQRGHKAHSTQGPVSSESALWSFDVIQHEES